MPESVIGLMATTPAVRSVSNMHLFSVPQLVKTSDGRPIVMDLRRTADYVVVDRRGRLVGRVECPMYGTGPDIPDALSVKAGLFSWHRRMVPADTIEEIDGASRVIGLRIDRESLKSFL
jgi:hypothetical protein